MTGADGDGAALAGNIRMATKETLVTLPAIPLIVPSLYLTKGPMLAASFWIVVTGSFVVVDVVNGRFARHGALSSFLSNGTLAGLMTLACSIGYGIAS